MRDKGYIIITYISKCKCGYEEHLEGFDRDPSSRAKKQGWVWHSEDGWKCPTCQYFEAMPNRNETDSTLQ